MKTQRRRLLAGLGTMAGGALASARVWAQGQAGGQPDRPVTVVVPYPPGASTDQVARLVQSKMMGSVGQSVVIDYKPGGSGTIGAAYVARSPADSHRILLATQPILTISPHLQSMGFDTLKDLTPLTNAVNAVVAIAVHPSLPVNTLAELIDYSRRNPGTLSFGSAGAGSPQHVGGILLGQRAGLDWQHVGYKGGGPMNTDLLAGHIKCGIATLSVFKPFMADRRLKVIALGEPTRYPGAPDVPTIAETVPGFELNTWLAFYGPAGMPAAQVAFYANEIRKALLAPDVSARLAEVALIVDPQGPESLARLTRRDFELYGKVIRDNGITGG